MDLDIEPKIILPTIVHGMKSLKHPELLSGLDYHRIDTALGTDGIIIQIKKDIILVCLAGSNELLDFLINFGKGANQEGIHWGFSKANDLLIEMFRNSRFLDELTGGKTLAEWHAEGNPPFIWHVGGYSNGAAIANLFACYLSDLGQSVTLATWGEPCLYKRRDHPNTDSLSYYWRVQNRLDIVSYIPFNLRHSAKGRTIITKGNNPWGHSFDQYLNQTAGLVNMNLSIFPRENTENYQKDAPTENI